MADGDIEFVSIPEWARRLKRSPLASYQAAGRGEIPGAFRIGRRWSVNWNAFLAATASARGLMVAEPHEP